MEPFIKVGILSSEQIEIIFNGKYKYKNFDISGSIKAKIVNDNIELKLEDELTLVENSFSFDTDNFTENNYTIKNVIIGVDFHWEKKEDQKFEGNLSLIIENGKITVINIVPVENYITSVISSEMSAKSSAELLKAHAIISRSWLLAQIEKGNEIKSTEQNYCNTIVDDDEIIKWYDREDHENFDVCADDHCQRYQGITKQFEDNCANAVKETYGIVLKHNNKICDARFSKSCGGISESFENVWENVEHPYLKAIVDSDNKTDFIDLTIEKNAENWIRNSPAAFCNTTDEEILSQVLLDFDQSTKDFYRWKVEYSQEELSNLLLTKSGFDFGEILDLIPVERGESGRLIKLKIVGSKLTKVIGKELEIRRILSKSHLYSSAIVFDKYDLNAQIPGKFVLTGAGWGHGVGLCQIGAAVMGEKGYNYNQILEHYFLDTVLEKIY